MFTIDNGVYGKLYGVLIWYSVNSIGTTGIGTYH